MLLEALMQYSCISPVTVTSWVKGSWLSNSHYDILFFEAPQGTSNEYQQHYVFYGELEKIIQ